MKRTLPNAKKIVPIPQRRRRVQRSDHKQTKSLAELIQTEVNPRKVLAALKRAAFRDGDRRALTMLVEYQAGCAPKNPPPPQPSTNQPSLKNLDDYELKVFEFLTSKAYGKIPKSTPIEAGSLYESDERLAAWRAFEAVYRTEDFKAFLASRHDLVEKAEAQGTGVQ